LGLRFSQRQASQQSRDEPDVMRPSFSGYVAAHIIG